MLVVVVVVVVVVVDVVLRVVVQYVVDRCVVDTVSGFCERSVTHAAKYKAGWWKGTSVVRLWWSHCSLPATQPFDRRCLLLERTACSVAMIIKMI